MGQNAEKEAGLAPEGGEADGVGAAAAVPGSPEAAAAAKAADSMSAGLLETYMQRFELSREAVIGQKMVFDALDVDGSGEIKLVEVKAKLAEMAKGGERMLTDEEVDAQFKELDVDGSGGVTFQEFLKVYVKAEFGRDTKIEQEQTSDEQVHDLTYEKPDSRKSVHVLPSLDEDEAVVVPSEEQKVDDKEDEKVGDKSAEPAKGEPEEDESTKKQPQLEQTITTGAVFDGTAEDEPSNRLAEVDEGDEDKASAQFTGESERKLTKSDTMRASLGENSQDDPSDRLAEVEEEDEDKANAEQKSEEPAPAGDVAGWLEKDDRAVQPEADGSGERAANDDDDDEDGPRDKAKESKQRTLEQMMSLKPGDDERTELSKKISWILRHGAKKVNIAITEDGWVRVQALTSSDILAGVPAEKLMSIIEESNAQKIRYEMRDEDDGSGQQIRAISKTERAGTIREQRRTRREAEDGQGNQGGQSGQGGQGPGWEPRPDRGRRMMKPDDPNRGNWEGEGGGEQQRPTFEQQLRDGFRPVYQGEKIVAMVRDDETVRPGRGAPERERGKAEKGDGKGDFKGDGKGLRDQRERGDRDHDRDGGYPDRRDRRQDDRGERMDRRDTRVERGDRDGEGRAFRDPRPRWRVNAGQDVILRDTDDVQSTVVSTLCANTVVAQMGEERVLPNGIVRMQVEVLEPNPGAQGWVTRTAEAAGGPVFFRPDRTGGRGPGKGRGGKDNRDPRMDQRTDRDDDHDRRDDRNQRDDRDQNDYRRDAGDNRGGYGDGRGGYGDNRGGVGDNRGGYGENRGGYGDKGGGGYGDKGGGKGDNRGFDNRGGKGDNRGGYDRGGYDRGGYGGDNRGRYGDNRGGYGDKGAGYGDKGGGYRDNYRDSRVDNRGGGDRGDRPMKGGSKGGKRKPDYDGSGQDK